MIGKEDIRAAALRCGFDDVGFTTADVFTSQREILDRRRERYGWTKEAGFDLEAGVDPRAAMPGARSIIVLLSNYYTGSFPPNMAGSFGRCYQDDDRITKDGLSRKIKGFRSFLTEQGISSVIPPNLPQRLAAARSGLGDFGKNCLFYAGRTARLSSWVLPVALVIDREIPPDEPTIRIGCPSWCRNACIAACPTGALTGPGELDPRKCISFLSYFGPALTPRHLREPMGMWVYGCDRCQEVCPRNSPWMNQALPVNERIREKATAFDLALLLCMDKDYFETKIWPHMFYISPREKWRWQMNAARAMGNSRDPRYLSDLGLAFASVENDNVRAMAAWAIGRIGGTEARLMLEKYLPSAQGIVQEEITQALDSLGR